MEIAYIRERKALTAAEQEEILAGSGISDFSELGYVWRDEPPKRRGRAEPKDVPNRKTMIEGLREGDTVVVADAQTLFLPGEDMPPLLYELARRNARLRICKPDITLEFDSTTTAALDVVSQLVQLVTGGHSNERTRNAREAKAKLGAVAKGGRPKEFKRGQKRYDVAREQWQDNDLTSSEIAKQAGVSVQTLNREFGPRGLK